MHIVWRPRPSKDPDFLGLRAKRLNGSTNGYILLSQLQQRRGRKVPEKYQWRATTEVNTAQLNTIQIRSDPIRSGTQAIDPL